MNLRWSTLWHWIVYDRKNPTQFKNQVMPSDYNTFSNKISILKKLLLFRKVHMQPVLILIIQIN